MFSIFLSCNNEYKNIAQVSIFGKEPKIDGKIDKDEWNGAISTIGFQKITGKRQLDPRMGRTYFGFSEKYLYFLVISELPPDGKLITNCENRDSSVIFDDGIEIWIDPFRDERENKDLQRTLSLYQCIVNSLGVVYDVKFKGGIPDTGWNGRWEVANSIDKENKLWICEIRIPFEDLEIKENFYNRSIGVLISRNYKRPWEQATWFPHRGEFLSWFEYTRIYLKRESVNIQILDLGEKFFEGQPHFKVKILNLTNNEKQIKAKIEIFSSNMPSLSDEKILNILPKTSEIYEFKVPENRFHADADHYFDLKVSSMDNNEIYMMYRCLWTKAPEEKWAVRVGPNPANAVRVAFLPTYGILKIRIDPSYLGEEWKDINSGEILVTNKKGEIIYSSKLNWEKNPYEQKIKLGEIEEGEYTVNLKLNGYKEEFIRKFERKIFEWEGNKFGITDKVYKPFLPIKVNGKEVEVVLRKYIQDNIGLWSSIKAKGVEEKSDYKELLASPMVFILDGEKLEGKGKFTKISESYVIYEGETVNSPITIKTKCTTEYDGCMKVEMDLLPSQKEIKSLYLEIPLIEKLTPLFHVCTTSLRVNPAGYLPKGDGVIWTSSQFSDGNWYGNFKPYIWLGSEERGICWFADNDKGWIIDWEKQPPCLILEREKGILKLKVNLIQKPSKIEEIRHIVFGLMATPAKPMPMDWRKILLNQYYPGYKTIVWMGSTYWGCGEIMKEVYPLNKDMSILTKMQEVRVAKGTDTKKFIQGWERRNLSGELPKDMKDKKSIINLAEISLNMASKKSDYFSVYWEEFHSISQYHPETKIFKYEWGGGYEYTGIYNLAPSYIDFRCWFAAEFIRRGIGLYFDNAYPKRTYDMETSDAYFLPNGKIQPSANIWRHREYLKRIWILHQQLSPEEGKPIMLVHMTNTHIIPYLDWNQGNIDLEWFYGSRPSQEKYSPDLLRTESIGRQSGNIPFALASISGGTTKLTQDELLKISKTKFGTMVVHEIKTPLETNIEKKLWEILFNFGYGENDCEVYNYWDENYPLSFSDDEVKSILLKRNEEMLLIMCTWNSQPVKVKVNINTKLLGLNPFLVEEVTDEGKTGETYVIENNSFIIPLDGYDVKILKLKKKKFKHKKGRNNE